ncbi:NADH-ubiquinone oxidoreductase-F iron-sulfur binding region domain-containing protein [Mycolicibacterium pyrenivorans]|uniref:NADH-ubiquinone oxidoreductase-F iron-sulfur binding region domain-containing protein n=1 Tax=Mycolicibacterium pyrenivorans TaxID=187102 RepID=UPI0021F29CD8|nr:NADH-ubiquinone oxidoreductase-F iron-sulfur binding region domain-containing protein [Mycolicibacterium pyrenivorans]MCV7151609.1 SLBB domain-containing protein [Mycolicibacterium pyrenivorans]
MTAELLLPSQRRSLSEYLAGDGYTALTWARADPAAGRAALLSTTLTGLGGAHFPLSRKVAAMLDQPGPRAVVCNAAEDEPGSGKDLALLAANPHVVIEGSLIAAAALDAEEVVFYLSENATDQIAGLTSALAEHAERQPSGGPALRLVPAPDRYVAGEATAAVSAIDGGAGKPTGHPPHPTECGVGGRPTLVSNCETLANLPRMLRAAQRGVEPHWTRLTTLSGDIAKPGVYEVNPAVDTFAALIVRAGGLTGSGVLKALQPGGPSSRFLPATAAGTAIRDADIRAAGSQPGCLAVRVVTTDSCIVEICAEITDFFAREQCGQCPPCRMKTQTYQRTLQQISSGKGSWDLLDKLGTVEDFVSDMPRKCALIDMPTPPITSARTLFPGDFGAHIEYGSCAPTPTPAVAH